MQRKMTWVTSIFGKISIHNGRHMVTPRMAYTALREAFVTGPISSCDTRVTRATKAQMNPAAIRNRGSNLQIQ